MKICCPNCSFTGTVPDDKLIAPGMFATCPKCRTRFELSAPPPPAPPRTAPPRSAPAAAVVCPKCGASQEGGEICAGCGIVFAKYTRGQEARAAAEPKPAAPPPPPERGAPRSMLVPAAAILLVLAAVVWLFFTPHIAVRGMRAAAEERNAAKLSGYVNFPAVKESLKASLNAKIAAETAREKDNPFAGLGAALAAAFISPLIDALVTPESLAMIMQGDKPELGMAKKATPKSDPDTETTMAYEGVNSFVVTIRKKNNPNGETVGLVFNRDGLLSSWKLTALRLPL